MDNYRKKRISQFYATKAAVEWNKDANHCLYLLRAWQQRKEDADMELKNIVRLKIKKLLQTGENIDKEGCKRLRTELASIGYTANKKEASYTRR